MLLKYWSMADILNSGSEISLFVYSRDKCKDFSTVLEDASIAVLSKDLIFHIKLTNEF